jgi:hypothetical protein
MLAIGDGVETTWQIARARSPPHLVAVPHRLRPVGLSLAPARARRIDTVYNNADADGGDQKLRDSRFWYHAELVAADRLRRLLATVRAPDLVKVYDTLQNAALLNYYFFYPANHSSWPVHIREVHPDDGRKFKVVNGNGRVISIHEKCRGTSRYEPS